MDEPVPTIQDSSQLNPENTLVPENARVNSLHIYGSEAPPPAQGVRSFMETPDRIPNSENLQNKAAYVDRQVDMVTASISDETKAQLAAEGLPVNSALANNEYRRVEDLNSETANKLFEAEAENAINIERTLGQDRALQLFTEIKNLTDKTLMTTKGVTELEAASGAIGRLFEDPRFRELTAPSFYSKVQGWTHAIININGLAAQAVDAKMKAAHENFLANERNNGKAFVKGVTNQ